MINPKRVKLKKVDPPKLDPEEFELLLDVLYEAMKENYTKISKLLGVSRVTLKKWDKEPPTWPWWNYVLRLAIKHVVASMSAKGGITQKHRSRIIHLLSRLSDNDPLPTEIGNLAYELSGAEAHLRRLLARKGMFRDEIMKVANSGGYSQRSLESAARTLSIVKTQEGYGKDKRSYWRLPDQDDD